MRILVGLLITVSACGSSSGAGGADASTADTSGDSPQAIDAAIDAPPIALPLYATSNQMLYSIDVDTQLPTLVGPIGDAVEPAITVDGLALLGTNLIGITHGGGQLITISRTTGAVIARKTLSPVNFWIGMTVIPAGELGPDPTILVGGSSDGSLFRLDPATGQVTPVGSFKNAYELFSDLAWVHGAGGGLFATLHSGDCASVCLAKIDPATGTATPLRKNLGTGLVSLSGYRGALWGFNNAGPLLDIDKTTGATAIKFDPAIPWTEAGQ